VLLGAIGDVVRALPLLQRMRAAWPDAHITWAVEPAAAPIVTGHPALSRVVVFKRHEGVSAFARFLREVRQVEADLSLDLQRLFKSGMASWASRAPTRMGFHYRSSREGNWLFNNRFIPPVERFTSKLGHYQLFADELGLPRVPVSFGLQVTPEEAARAALLLQPAGDRLAVMFLGSTWPSRQWFAEAAAEVCRGLRDRGVAPVLIGVQADAAFSAEVESLSHGAALNYTGKTTLRDVIALASRATVAIGPDSGPMHIAAAVGTPVVSFWGATSPKRSAPYGFEQLVIQGEAPCVPCYKKECPIGRVCMQSITAAAVLERVDRVLTS
jgi:lipopolysaccharide heptosyltransferase II